MRRTYPVLLGPVALVAAITGCDSSNAGSAGSGGSPAAGGSLASGGRGGSSGAGNGGAPAAGNATGGAGTAGGTAGLGGAAGPGGSAGVSGSAGASGSAGMSGSSGAGGSAAGGGGSGGAGGAAGGGAAGGGGSTAVTVQLAQTHQTIEGFGLNTALSSGTIPWDTLYTTTGADAIGLSIVRVAVNSDGSISGDVSGAKSRGVKVIGSAWTPPANCKDNNNTQKGGHLKSTCYESFATTIANAAKNQGFYAMSAANEPDFASCGSTIGPPCNGDYDTALYTANEMVAFVKVLGPKLKDAGIKLIAPEPSEWIHLWSNTSATGSTVANHRDSSDPLKCGCFGTSTTCASTCTSGGGYDYGHWLAKDAAAWAAVDIIGVHEYDTQHAEPWPSDVDGGKPSKQVWETEVSGVMYWPEQGPSSDIYNGVAVAGWIHSALTVGEASAWLYWWYKAVGSNDNEGLVLQGSNALTKRYYALGNYSKFVRPGSVRVDVSGSIPADVLLSAYKATDGSVVIVAINKGTASATVPIAIAGGTAPTACTPNVTSSTANLTAGTAITVTAAGFSASLAGTTVTTFVCK